MAKLFKFAKQMLCELLPFLSQSCLLHIASRQIRRPFDGTSQERLVNFIFTPLSLARLCEMFLKRRFVVSLCIIISTDTVGKRSTSFKEHKYIFRSETISKQQ